MTIDDEVQQVQATAHFDGQSGCELAIRRLAT